MLLILLLVVQDARLCKITGHNRKVSSSYKIILYLEETFSLIGFDVKLFFLGDNTDYCKFYCEKEFAGVLLLRTLIYV
jgi:hypothetical protein